MLPPFHVIKCTISKSNGDLSSATVLKTLSRKAYTPQTGWNYLMWERKLKLAHSNTFTYKRPYLWHKDSGTVITIQNKAWMDTVGLCMWADVIVKPWAQGRPKLIIWDNCPSHGSEEIVRVFSENRMAIDFLPKNMTDKLQVMDLVVNGP